MSEQEKKPSSSAETGEEKSEGERETHPAESKQDLPSLPAEMTEPKAEQKNEGETRTAKPTIADHANPVKDKNVEEKQDASSQNPAKSEIEAKGESKPQSETTPKAPRAATAGKARPAPAARPRPAVKKEEKSEEPSPLQPLLDRYVKIIKEKVSQEAIEEAYINRPNAHLPMLVIHKKHWEQVAQLLKSEPSLSFDYIRNISGVDYETHFEVVYHLISMTHSHQIGIRVKTDRVEALMPSVSHVWEAANWNEREIYDLLGVRFAGHPNLERILMPDDWVGHPLRKDYEPLDKEV